MISAKTHNNCFVFFYTTLKSVGLSDFITYLYIYYFFYIFLVFLWLVPILFFISY